MVLHYAALRASLIDLGIVNMGNSFGGRDRSRPFESAGEMSHFAVCAHGSPRHQI
jgi:hypothetical protein